MDFSIKLCIFPESEKVAFLPTYLYESQNPRKFQPIYPPWAYCLRAICFGGYTYSSHPATLQNTTNRGRIELSFHVIQRATLQGGTFTLHQPTTLQKHSQFLAEYALFFR